MFKPSCNQHQSHLCSLMSDLKWNTADHRRLILLHFSGRRPSAEYLRATTPRPAAASLAALFHHLRWHSSVVGPSLKSPENFDSPLFLSGSGSSSTFRFHFRWSYLLSLLAIVCRKPHATTLILVEVP